MLREVEDRIENRIKTLTDRLKRLEDNFDEQEKRFKRDECIPREEYEEDSKRRAEENLKIRENLSVTNGFLRGVMAATGYIDQDPDTNPGVPGLRRK